jgi:hypothetical protein
VTTLPPGWAKRNGLYIHDHPRMYVRRGLHKRWWATVKLGDVEWHSFDHETARDAMLAAGTLAALLGSLAEAEKRGMERAAEIADGFTCGGCGMDGKAAAAIRAAAQGETP